MILAEWIRCRGPCAISLNPSIGRQVSEVDCRLALHPIGAHSPSTWARRLSLSRSDAQLTKVHPEKRALVRTEYWEVRLAGEKIDVEMQDTGEFLASIHTSTGTDEIVLMFSDAEEVSEGVLSNDETTARATVEFLLSH